MAEQVANEGMIESFKNKVRAWWANVEKLRATKVPVNKQKEKDALLSRAETIRKTIRGLTSWSDTLRINELDGMGFLPLIPVAVIGGAVAAIGYWANDYAKFAKAINYQSTLVSQGIAPDQAAIMAQQQAESGSTLFQLSGIMKIAALMGIGWFVYKKYVK